MHTPPAAVSPCPSGNREETSRHLADGVHAVNNWLNVLAVSVEVLRLRVAPGTPADALSLRVIEAGRRMTAECNQLMAHVATITRPPSVN